MREKKEETEEKKIPVFTVFKKGLILENIYIFDMNTPSPLSAYSESIKLTERNNPKDNEEMLLVGRHRDCNIKLKHPSISRFHLRMRLQPSLQKLSVIDLSSAHGTWVSDRKIEPQVSVELSEGDSLRLGASTRSYRLHWIPLSRVFDVENSDETEEEKMSSPPMPEFTKYDNPLFETPEFMKFNNPLFDKENQEKAPTTFAEPVTVVEESQENEPFRLEDDSNTPSLWSRRGKPASLIRIQTARSKGKKKKVSLGVGIDSENCNARSLIPQVPFAGSDSGDHIVISGKENYTPKTAHRSQSGMKGRMEELADQKFYNSLSLNGDENESMSTVSEKENLAPIVFNGSRLTKPFFGSQLRHEEEMIMSKRRLGRVPFRSLVIDSNMSNKSEVSVSKTTTRGRSFCDKTNDTTVSNYANQSYGEASSRWYMVVDTNCLLNKDSRRLRQLLQGLRGTQFIIPRLVTRELDILKRRGSLSGRANEVTSVLQWIEQCKMETKWWIHVQNTMEESRSITPTPPASPHFSSWLSEASSGVFGRSPWGSLEEIVSPTAEDHILDCAHLFTTIKKDHELLVPLSDDIFLLTKAMAEVLVHLSGSSGPLESETAPSLPLLMDRILPEKMKQQFDKENQEKALTTFAEAVTLVEESQENEPFRLEDESNTPSLWSRRSKPASLIRIQTARSKGKKEVGLGVGTDSENCNVRSLIPHVLFAGSDRGDHIVISGKENYTPKTARRSQSGMKGRMEELSDQKFYNSLSLNGDENRSMSTVSEKENLEPIVFNESRLKKPLFGSQLRHEEEMIMSKRRLGRVPFRSLVIESNKSNKSEVSVSKTTTRGSSFCDKTNDTTVSIYPNQSYGEASRRWYMVVDTNCLLNKDSRRLRQLLQGLKGTQLIIPRLVTRELDILKRRGSLSGRATEVTSVLQWIEQCKMETKWWTHVQNTMEESRSITPTPPASPHFSSWLSEASSGVFGRSPWGSLEEIVSPTAEDHILDCALLFTTIKKDHEQLVPLSDDNSLMTKAMAEVLVCETAEEFQGSLVNPYSSRFLWVQSTRRGPSRAAEVGNKVLELTLLIILAVVVYVGLCC